MQEGSERRVQALSQDPEVEVAVSVYACFRRKVSRPWLRHLALLTLASEGETGASIPRRGLSLVIADDGTLRDLNHRYRGMDQVTDVLAFASFYSESATQGREWPSNNGVPFYCGDAEEDTLGEIVISYPQTERQAREQGIPIRRELALLVVHGLLHLLGYDHDNPQNEGRMWKRQDVILARLLREA